MINETRQIMSFYKAQAFEYSKNQNQVGKAYLFNTLMRFYYEFWGASDARSYCPQYDNVNQTNYFIDFLNKRINKYCTERLTTDDTTLYALIMGFKYHVLTLLDKSIDTSILQKQDMQTVWQELIIGSGYSIKKLQDKAKNALILCNPFLAISNMQSIDFCGYNAYEKQTQN